MRKLYAIYGGLGGGFGGATFQTVEKFENEEKALEYARNIAVEDYHSYEGLNGIMTEEECEEEGVEYEEKIDSWIDYDAVEIVPENYENIIEECNEIDADRIMCYMLTIYFNDGE